MIGSHDLYAEDTFGTILKRYVRREFRPKYLGFDFITQANNCVTQLEATGSTHPTVNPVYKPLVFYGQKALPLLAGAS
tara:strand:- start:270 stop:503 length:234 start_codon:yes stop_codon:yes gene_type:complete